MICGRAPDRFMGTIVIIWERLNYTIDSSAEHRTLVRQLEDNGRQPEAAERLLEQSRTLRASQAWMELQLWVKIIQYTVSSENFAIPKIFCDFLQK